MEALTCAAPAPDVRGTPYHPLHNPYLTADPATTMLVLVNAMLKVVTAMRKGHLA